MKIQRATRGKWLQSPTTPYTFSEIIYLPDNAEQWQEVDDATKLRIESEQEAEVQEEQPQDNNSAELLEQPQEDNSAELLEQAKRVKIAEVEAYDSSENVNQFTYNGVPMWLDKDTRVGLRNLLDMQKNSGMSNTLIWYEGMKIELPIETAYKLLTALELYAFECYNATESHKVAIQEMTTIEEVEAYDVTQGYPNKLEL